MIPKRRIFRLSPEARNILLVSATCFGITAGVQMGRPGPGATSVSPQLQLSAPSPQTTIPSPKVR